MKLSLSSFRINTLNRRLNKFTAIKNGGKEVYLLLIVLLIPVIIYLLYSIMYSIMYSIIYSKLLKPHYKEGLGNPFGRALRVNTGKAIGGALPVDDNNTNATSDSAAGLVESASNYGMDKVDYLDDKVSSGLDSVIDYLRAKKEIPPQWRDFYGDGEMGETDIYKELPDTSTIINDSCSTKGFLYSEYNDDMCTKYGRKPRELDEKCKSLSVTNCKIPSCCVLLNGKQCRAGNIHGPLFLTDKGKDIDFSFYYNKQRCYGKCDTSANPLEKCDKYLNNSVGISKECMLQMFNHYGCSNPDPDYFINDAMIKKYSLSSKAYIENHIKTEIGNLANDRYNLDNIIKCKGRPYVIEKYRMFNTSLEPTTSEQEIMDILQTQNQIGLEQVFLNYYK